MKRSFLIFAILAIVGAGAVWLLYPDFRILVNVGLVLCLFFLTMEGLGPSFDAVRQRFGKPGIMTLLAAVACFILASAAYDRPFWLLLVGVAGCLVPATFGTLALLRSQHPQRRPKKPSPPPDPFLDH